VRFPLSQPLPLARERSMKNEEGTARKFLPTSH
jgi:hypothetical protein